MEYFVTLQLKKFKMNKRISFLVAIILLSGFVLFSAFQKKGTDRIGHPWATEQVIQPAELAHELIQDSSQKILVLNIGPVDDIKNAISFGPVEKKKNLRKLKKFLKKQPKDEKIVFYCGCCEMETCPNILPAFEILDKMGFTNFKILDIEKNLDQDWISKGYPMAGK